MGEIGFKLCSTKEWDAVIQAAKKAGKQQLVRRDCKIYPGTSSFGLTAAVWATKLGIGATDMATRLAEWKLCNKADWMASHVDAKTRHRAVRKRIEQFQLDDDIDTISDCYADPRIKSEWDKYRNTKDKRAKEQAIQLCSEKYADPDAMFTRRLQSHRFVRNGGPLYSDTVRQDMLAHGPQFSSRLLALTAEDRARLVLVSPAESFVVCYRSITLAKQLWIKGKRFSLRALIGDQLSRAQNDDEKFAAYVFRLTPRHYHRFHVFSDGILKRIAYFPGSHISVDNRVVNSWVNVLTDNVRMVLEIETDFFGTVYFAIVGATCVHSIELHLSQMVRPGVRDSFMTFMNRAKKDGGVWETTGGGIPMRSTELLGAFRYGSTLVLAVPNHLVTLSPFLAKASANGLETEMLVGQPVGYATGNVLSRYISGSQTTSRSALTDADLDLFDPLRNSSVYPLALN